MNKNFKPNSILIFSFLLVIFSCNRPDEEVVIQDVKQWDLTKIVNDPMFISLNNTLKLAPRAEIFYSRENGDKNYTRISSTKKVAKSASITENGIPYFYVFNYKNGGWVIISSDKRMMPILAYSKTGTFNNEDIPIGLILCENATKQIIKDLRNSNS